jgi:hypothetical protein
MIAEEIGKGLSSARQGRRQELHELGNNIGSDGVDRCREMHDVLRC